jgi:RNA polymerase sigma-54 factor
LEDREVPDAPTEDERELVIEDGRTDADFQRLLNMDEQWPEHFEEHSRPSRAQIEEAGARKLDAMANMPAQPQTLHDYLRDQLAWFNLAPELRSMAERIIYNLDPNGYLQGRLEDLLGPEASAGELALAQRALAVVQKLDPPGVGARNLRECLLLQLYPGMTHYEELKTLISEHLEDLEHNRLPAISRRRGYSLELIQELLGELRRLNPKPGAIFSHTPAQPVIPDVLVEQTEDGRYVVRLEDSRTPNLCISPYYRKLLASGGLNEATRDYIKRKVNSAQWLIEAIEQRRNTLLRVAQAIVDHQIEFLRRGPEAIEPLKMQQIADKVGFHVTTVSRAVDDKWIQTPRGIFPLRRFFCGGTTSAAGEEIAWDVVRLKLQELIDGEDKRAPLSDEQLRQALAAQGIKVSRRTITKYRELLNIPSSRERRVWTENSSAANPQKRDDKK